MMGDPSELAVRKSITRLDKHCREFIRRSPFVCIGTSNGEGKADVSPKGDPPGFVQVLDDQTLFIPDRPGNNRLDSMSNLVMNPAIALLFLIPGFNETLRVNGQAVIVQDDTLNQQSSINGRTPKVGIQVSVETAFLHCAKAFKRSKLWEPESRQNRKEMPSLGQIIIEQATPAGQSVEQDEVVRAELAIEKSSRTRLY
jgi:hypothetical protein